MSDSLQPHESQHTRPPCPSPTPGAYSNSCPSSRWCHPAILSSVVPFSSCPKSLPASGSFPMSQLFASGGQSIGVSASASVHQHLHAIFWIITILTGVRWYLIVVLICIPLMIVMSSIFSCVLGPSICCLWKKCLCGCSAHFLIRLFVIWSWVLWVLWVFWILTPC